MDKNHLAQLKKGLGEFCVLTILSKQESYPAEVVKALKRAEFNLATSTVYPMLKRLAEMGYLSYQWVETGGGPPRKYYSITETGIEFLDELRQSWKELSHAVLLLTRS